MNAAALAPKGEIRTLASDSDMIAVPRGLLGSALHCVRKHAGADSETHRKLSRYALSPAPHTAWIDWNGGDCPVPDSNVVEVEWLNSATLKLATDLAGFFNWKSTGRSRHGLPGDILRYRVIHSTAASQYTGITIDEAMAGTYHPGDDA